MKNELASTPLPTTTTDARDTRIDIDRLETAVASLGAVALMDIAALGTSCASVTRGAHK
jgi:hypothetical protein